MREESTQNTIREEQWSNTRPLLDEAVSELRERDRDAIVLRFFENRNFSEIGVRLGLGENAARIRVNRALEKLNGLMAQRGFRSTASALAAALAGQITAAAPPALAKFFGPSFDPEILERFEIAMDEVLGSPPKITIQELPTDPLWDALVKMSDRSAVVFGDNQPGPRIEIAIDAFLKSQGRMPADASELEPYIESEYDRKYAPEVLRLFVTPIGRSPWFETSE